ncbi:MAG: excinuclease ABC subunit UvrC [Candidatus Melainabacteria bacterium]|nr:excinuclease ABC subunit UvrC [Candidatus Melainabacteria bacterium]
MNANPFDLQAELKNLPAKTGVYRMYDAEDTLIYIGKAKLLKNRVRSYFQTQANHSPKTRAMVAQIHHFNVIVTNTEVEALILEDSLIKQFKPRYNILLRDDRRFPWIGLTNEPYPRLFTTRTPKRLSGSGKTRFFGPYTNSGELYGLLKVLRQHFPLRKRPKPLFKDRPCMNYSLGLCSGPCQELITQQQYQAIVDQVVLVLKGKTKELEESLQQQMWEAAENLNFERATELRNRLQAIDLLAQKQQVVSDDTRLHQDVIALAEDGWVASITVLSIRYGKLIASKPFTVPLAHGATAEEAYDSFVLQYYRGLEADDLPDELILQHPLSDEDVVTTWLSAVRGRKVGLVHPQQGNKAELLKLALTNAQAGLEQAKLYEASRLQNDPVRALQELQTWLNLPTLPKRMECFDISHFQGSQTVASMVVFVDGVPDKSQYRHFKVRCAEGKPDDFASMYEVLGRRLTHRDDWGVPNLLIIDGGKGQLSSAVRALRESGWEQNQPIVSLAKRYEEVFIPNQERPILIPHSSPALFVLQQIRDESHRFAITFHRALRTKNTYKSPLDEVAGVGKHRKEKLLQHFRTWEAITQATVDELEQVLGCSTSVAEDLFEAIQLKALEVDKPKQ